MREGLFTTRAVEIFREGDYNVESKRGPLSLGSALLTPAIEVDLCIPEH